MRLITLALQNSSATLTGYLRDDHEGVDFKKSILIFPGGGYTQCSEREGEPIALAYLAQGFQAFVLTYRTSDPLLWDETMADANQAMIMLHEHAKDWHLDKDKIALIGFSAGGHLAASLTFTAPVQPCATILCYPLILGSLAKLISPQLPGIIDLVHHESPPIFIFSTFEDHVVPVKHTLSLLHALHVHKVAFECHIFEWGHHGLALATNLSAQQNPKAMDDRAQSWLELSISWLNRLYETNFQPPNMTKANTLGAMLEDKAKKLQLEKDFPFLQDQDIAQALSYLTWEAFLDKMMKYPR